MPYVTPTSLALNEAYLASVIGPRALTGMQTSEPPLKCYVTAVVCQRLSSSRSVLGASGAAGHGRARRGGLPIQPAPPLAVPDPAHVACTPGRAYVRTIRPTAYYARPVRGPIS